MSIESEAVNILQEAFSGNERPKVFNKYIDGDEEFLEHDRTLQNRTPENITRDDLGSVGWNPISTMTIDAWRYWLPSLGKIAVSLDEGDRGLFLFDLIIYLENPEKNDELIKLNKKERLAILCFLERIIPMVKEKMEPDVMVEFELLPLIEQWKSFSNFDQSADSRAK